MHRVFLRRVVEVLYCRAHLYLYQLRGTFTHVKVMFLTHIFNDLVGEIIAGDAYRLVCHYAAECDNGDLCCSAAYIDYHIAHRFKHIDADTDSGCHWLMYEAHLFSAGLFCAIFHSPLLHLGNTRRYSYHHPQCRREESVVEFHHLDKLAKHIFRRLEVSDDTVTQRPNSLDILMGLAMHHHSAFAHSHNLVGVTLDSNNRRLIDDNLVIIDDEGVGGAEVYCQFFFKE